MNTFTINGKKYEGSELEFYQVIELEDQGLSIIDGNFGKKPMKAITAYLAMSGGMTIEEAAKEINEHFIKTGDLSSVVSEIMGAFNKAMSESGFFRKAKEKAATENPEVETTPMTNENTEV